jgi:hypothetical protein
MDSQARVASLDRFRDFRAAYAKFGDAATQVLIGVDIEIRRMLDWLEKDQVAFWKGEIRRLEDKVNEAKGALHRKRITATFGGTASDTDEVVALRKAQARLEAAEKKLKAIKQWCQIVEQEVSEYRGPAQVLAAVLDGDVPRALSSLDRMTDTIESYLSTQAPAASEALNFGPGPAAVQTEGASISAPTKAEVAAAAASTSEGAPAEPDKEDREGAK